MTVEERAQNIHAMYEAAALAEHRVSMELRRLYGKDAGTRRYQPCGSGEPGSELATLWAEWKTAVREYMERAFPDTYSRAGS